MTIRSIFKGSRLLALGATAALVAACPSKKEVVTPKTDPVKTTPPDVAKSMDAPVEKRLPVDARVTTGTLDNGMRYFILPHKKPEKRAQLWLSVNAGAVQEDDDQRGLAHFVEHMAFNGTENFEKMAIVNYLEKIGMKFGADVNAYTSFDETVYTLQLPTDDKSAMDKGFAILREWAGRVSFDPKEVEKERGVVLEEWRRGRGAQSRLFDKQFPVWLKGSKYANRLPIGLPEILKNAPRDRLVQFYKDWYRPDLMAVIAVGDFDKAAIEQQIKATFSDVKGPDKPRPRTAVAVPPHKETLVTVETDKELPQTVVYIINKAPPAKVVTIGDYRNTIAESLYTAMVSERLDKIRRRPDAPFMFAQVAKAPFVRGADLFLQIALAKQGKHKQALQLLLEEALRVERHGFTAGELARAKKNLLRRYQSGVKERDKLDGKAFAQEINNYFLKDDAMPGVEAELELVERFLPTLQLSQLNEMAKQWSGSENRVVSINGSDKMQKPEKSAVLAWVGEVASRKIEPYSETIITKPMIEKKPTPGTIASETAVEGAEGLLVWKLSNGAKVVIKQTDFKNEEILVSGVSPGGTSLASKSEWPSARFAAQIVAEGGVADFSPSQVRMLMAGKIASVQPWIGEIQEGIQGSSSPADLETFFQLLHLRFTAPRKDVDSFTAWKSNRIEQVRNARLDPQTAFFEDLTAFRYRNHPRRKPLTEDDINKVELDKAIAFYRDRFANAGDFTFTIVGNVDPAKLKPLVEMYIASLPAKKKADRWKDIGARFPSGKKTLEQKRGKEPKATVSYTFHGRQRWSPDAENDMQMLSEILRIRLREVLREDLGGVYGVRSFGGISREPRQEGVFRIQFTCDPDKVDELKKAVFTVIKEIQSQGASDENIGKIKTTRVRSFEVDSKTNRFWLRKLSESYYYGDDPAKILKYQEMVDKITSKRIKSAAKKYISTRRFVLGVLMPEDKPAPAKKTGPVPAPTGGDTVKPKSP